jgi:uncharacterized membrane protein YccC
MPLLIFIATALVSAVLWHQYVSHYFAASVAATATAVVVFQVLAYIELGYVDPFALIAVATSSVVALAIALVIGLPFRARRKRKANDHAL